MHGQKSFSLKRQVLYFGDKKGHSRLVKGVAELLAGVHAEGSSTLPEPDALGPVAAAVAGLAEELLLVFRASCGVEQLVAHGCVKT